MEQSRRRGFWIAFALASGVMFSVIAAFLAYSLLSAKGDDPSIRSSAPYSKVAEDGPSGLIEVEQPTLTGDQSSGASSEIEFVATVPEAQPTQSPTVTPVREPVITVDYVVRPGDTLYSISQNHNSSIELMAIHGLDAGDLITGNQIRLPVVNPGYCTAGKAYLVREGDTLYAIAVSNNTSVEAIVAANRFEPGHIIRTAEVICLPG